MTTSCDTPECLTRKRPRKRIPLSPVCIAIGTNHIPTNALPLPPATTCNKCQAQKFAFECKTFCCYDGEVKLAPNEIPPELVNLFTQNDEYATHFKQYARIYNNYFAFSSLGGNIERKTKKGVYTFRIQGQAYHYLPDLLPSDTNPKYLQMYFYDGASELDSRLTQLTNLKPEIISMLITIMDRNPYAHFFRSLRYYNITEETRISISRSPILDQRVYNTPTSEEVAAIISDNSNTHQINSPDIIVKGKSNESHRVMHYYGCYDPLQYPLLHLKGESGWHQGLKRVSRRGSRQSYDDVTFPISTCLVQNAADLLTREAEVAQIRPPKEGKEISCREYYAYKIQVRPHNYLIYSGRLFQQYIVDMYVKIENTRLDFFRRNQATIRSELYQGVLDSLNQGHSKASDIGCRIILPPSFIGGPRDMKRRYLNAMTLVQKYGKPDLFITITCNPNWPEIQKELMPGEKPENRPELLCRIFRAKLVMLKTQIVEKKIFGVVAARVDVIEFQKRGLPHAHLLIILTAQHKIINPDDFDKYVCAELPSDEYPRLRKIVLKHMIHGPCGHRNPNCPCMKKSGDKKTCKYNYPKKFADYTTCADDSYPIYRRRKNSDTVFLRGAKLDNRWVIPYNPYLLAAFDCHINVEVCSTIKAVKYLYKYVYKGNDRINFNITKDTIANQDEIQSYQSGRWISPPEAAWRILSLDLYDIYPAVIPLQVHLPGMQPVTFREHETLESVASDAHRQTTMLGSFFRHNLLHQPEHKFLYHEFPEHYVWDQSSKVWNIRKQRTTIGRLAYVSPSEGERYYLRLLLANIRGPPSFESLLEVNGYTCTTFKEAAQKNGLMEANGYAESCMEEAIHAQMPRALRRLFATLLIFGEIENPQALWQQYFNHLSEDFSRLYKNDTSKIFNLTWTEIDNYLEGMGKSLKFYNLHNPIPIQAASLRITKDISDAMNTPIPTEYVGASKLLNTQQHIAYKTIMHHIKTKKGGAFFIDGPGGSGKTFLYCTLYAKVRSLGKIVLPTATSGIAASNIPTGRTAHSRFKIPLDTNDSFTCNISKQSSLAFLLKETSLFIWDEASMAKKKDIESFNALLQDICESQDLFGGKVVVFGGDFRQVLPVLPRKNQQEAVEASLVSSYLWPHLMKFHLTENIRSREDQEFSNFLLQLGNGRLQSQEQAFVYLPPQMITCFNIENDSTDLLISTIFPEIQQPSINSDIFSDKSILTPKNEDVDSINAAIIEKFPGIKMTYKSFDSIIDDHCNLYPIEFLNTLCPSGMSPHELNLKENCPVILLRNLDPPNGLCNGTRMICKQFFKNIIQCEISTGCYKGENVFIPRITLKPPSATQYPFQFQRKQFPIKLCFAMTINKAQGQTLKQVSIYLKQPCFSHGQLYVALSRARKSSHVTVFKSSSTDIPNEAPLVKNVISFEVLKRAHII